MNAIKAALVLSSAVLLLSSPAQDIQLVQFSDEKRFLFFAVLEGLYNDGLSEESVSSVMGENITDHFIIACPICLTAYEALEAYRDAPAFTSKTYRVKGFGPGLAVEERKALAGDLEERRQQIRALIHRWVEARFVEMDWPEEREATMREAIRRMSEKGAAALEHLKKGGAGEDLANIYADWEFCPSCSGATWHDAPAREPQ